MDLTEFYESVWSARSQADNLDLGYSPQIRIQMPDGNSEEARSVELVTRHEWYGEQDDEQGDEYVLVVHCGGDE